MTQDVALGDRVELTCDLGDPVWVIRDIQDGEESYIHPQEINPVPPVLQNRGFISDYQISSRRSLLRIPGSSENNQTLISCQILADSDDDNAFYIILNVIGS